MCRFCTPIVSGKLWLKRRHHMSLRWDSLNWYWHNSLGLKVLFSLRGVPCSSANLRFIRDRNKSDSEGGKKRNGLGCECGGFRVQPLACPPTRRLDHREQQISITTATHQVPAPEPCSHYGWARASPPPSSTSSTLATPLTPHQLSSPILTHLLCIWSS